MSDNPQRQFVICTTARSGSNLFCSFLRNTKLLGLPIEAFNPDIIRRSGFGREHAAEDSLSVASYIDWIQINHRTKNGVFGTKLLYEDFDSFKGFDSFTRMLKNSVLIHLRRRSKLGQAISYYFAEMTGQWVASDKPVVAASDVTFDFEKIESHLNRLIVQDSTWTAVLNGAGLPFHEVYFEDFIKNPRLTIDALMAMLDFSHSDFPVFSEMKEQSNARSKEFSRLFSEELRRRLFKTTETQQYKKSKFRA